MRSKSVVRQTGTFRGDAGGQFEQKNSKALKSEW